METMEDATSDDGTILLVAGISALALQRARIGGRRLRLLTGLALAAGAIAASAADAQGPRPGRPLTPPSQADALQISMDYLRGQRTPMGLAADDLEEMAVTDRYETARTGTTHLYLRQQIDGIDVFGGEVSISVDAQGRMRTVGDRLIRGLRGRVTNRVPALTAGEAVLAAAAHLGIEPAAAPQRQLEEGGAARAVVLSAPGLSRDPIPAKLAYVLESTGALRLAWNLVIRTPDGVHWWNLHVDSGTGRVLRQNDWIARDSYNVYPLPQMSPDEGPRVLVVGAADPVASPFGWHDTNGIAGAEFTDTRGNNVSAQDDVDADDAGGQRPDGGAGLVFDFPIDLTLQPGNYIDASVTNLFYWNNILHDVMYQYGFDEAAGNFQLNNYGNGGAGNDPVQADSQDGSGTDNAQFGTPPDGFQPRMEMFRWLFLPSPRLIVSSPPAIAGTYFAGPGLFGAGTTGLMGTVVQALDPADGAGPSTTDACSPLTNPGAVAGNLVIIDRGTCLFIEKVGHAQDAGAIGAIIVNNAGDDLINMAGIDPTLTIPAIFLGQSDGAMIVAQLGTGVGADLVTPAARDSSLDSGVVVHEYGHGVSTRLTAGPANVSCLAALESAAMGEGWSDWWALVFTAKSGDVATDLRGVGPYVVGETASGGIRNFPYSTDLAQSPLTYGDIAGLNQPHGAGEVWAGSLWEMYWNLVDEFGFDPDLYAGSGGNNLALQLVMDGLKLQPCNPSMVDGRDAILSADQNANGGANECRIWAAFVKRGIGFSASDGGSSSTLAVVESFDDPPTCVPEPSPTLGLLSGIALLSVLARRRAGARGEPGPPPRSTQALRDRKKVLSFE
jgi:hypothetical protein